MISSRIQSYLLIILSLLIFSTNNILAQVSNFTVVIDAGHGGKDPGNTGNGFIEKDIALKISLNLGKILEDNGVQVIYTRKKDEFINIFERANIANRSDAQLFLSIHCDSHTSQAYGAGTFVLGLHGNQRNFEIAKKENSVIFFEDNYETTYDGFDPNNSESVIGLTLMQEEYLDQSIIAASYIQDSFVKKLKRKNRSVKQAGFIVLKYTYMPSVLIETGFLTNRKEGLYLNSRKGQSEMADAISFAVLRYRDDFFKNLSTEIKKDNTYDEKYFRVQIAASKKLIELKSYNFKGLKSVYVEKDGNLYKYYLGRHKSIEDANTSLKKARDYGYISSFIVSF
tara:strand:- start:26962 stop:27981 length:1020 start_codon:yes stop_codon:yes gene_type:complete